MLAERLKPGDHVGVVALAGPPCPEELERGICLLKSLGLQVETGRHIYEVAGYLAGTDDARLADFHTMVADPRIRAVFFARGGYGSGRIAPLIDYRLIRKHPKIYWGYSDMTYLLSAIRQLSGLAVFHGPMIASDLGRSEHPLEVLTSFHQLFVPRPTVIEHSEGNPLYILAGGEAEGELVGGNLSVIASMLGTPFELDTTNKIILLEDVNEPPYKIDSMLQQMTYAGKFAEAAGVVLGDFANAEPTGSGPSFTAEEVFNEYFGCLPIPVMKGVPIGHCEPNQPVPLGVKAILSASRRKLEIAPGVC
ncbi:LD-carboxypeptidase [Aciduricibacillus chroicocephali]|uniref:LD-carboxypeptidase n=1 Tax=Aciduricibacillus chroicocephali TaxID=3054939 RepID=A0ABY9KTW7_9BACI|nr:LD-carboxypeptidase [Bacillaceae bacterium 44XB]